MSVQKKDSDLKKDQILWRKFKAWLNKYPLDSDADAQSITKFLKRIFGSGNKSCSADKK